MAYPSRWFSLFAAWEPVSCISSCTEPLPACLPTYSLFTCTHKRTQSGQSHSFIPPTRSTKTLPTSPPTDNKAAPAHLQTRIHFPSPSRVPSTLIKDHRTTPEDHSTKSTLTKHGICKAYIQTTTLTWRGNNTYVCMYAARAKGGWIDFRRRH
jgi:hypothetical protein